MSTIYWRAVIQHMLYYIIVLYYHLNLLRVLMSHCIVADFRTQNAMYVHNIMRTFLLMIWGNDMSLTMVSITQSIMKSKTS